ncbi:hypothetical protein MFUM_1020002 [Methylacidiphilum fumariolicum SolV]|uniref:Uncharacterized protein n=2 Tax=Candidatus Methylacidiphilum fumarolicum TaxID=591154 RepID=I0JVL1_METFB|nr:conserved protein of unknown function [Candidatus Methylacidiphilum fumarolicum]CCG91280.1 hypothetical protein MFUM_1020002 [Methylacidiphilum fumariolicum SolV]
MRASPGRNGTPPAGVRNAAIAISPMGGTGDGLNVAFRATGMWSAASTGTRWPSVR